MREALPLVVAVLVVHRDLVLRGRVLFDRDVEQFLYERLAVMAAAVRAGAWPLWNPYHAFGEPLLAIANVQLAYPTSWLAVVLPPEITDSVTVVLHTLLAALGAWALARELGLTNRAALTAGVLWSCSGAYLSGVNQANVLIGATYIPWGWMAWARWGRTGHLSAAVGAGLAVGLSLLGGSPESALMAMAGIVFAVRAPEVRDLRRMAVAVLLALAVGLGVSAVQWLPTASIVPRSVRARLTRADMDSWSNHPARLAQLVLPLPVEHLPLRDDVRAVMFNGREPLLYSIYVGLGTLSLAAAALIGRPRRGRAVLLVVAAGAFVLSLGPHGLVWSLVRGLPPLSLVRFPERFSIAGTLALTVLAGMGVDALADPGRSGWRRAPLVLAGLVAACALAVAALARPASPLWRALLVDERTLGWSWSTSPTIRAAAGHMALAACLALIVAVALAWRARESAVPRWLPAAAALAAMLDPLVALDALNPTVPRSVLRAPNPAFAPLPRERPNRTFILTYPGAQSAAVLGRPTPTEHLYDATPEQRLWNDRYYPFSGLGTPGRSIESVPADVTALRDATMARWIETLHALESTPAFPRLLALSGISYVVALHDLTPAGFTLLGSTPGRLEPVRTFGAPATLPRAFVAGGVRVAQGQAAFQQLLDPAFDPRREIVLGTGTPAPAGDADAGTVRIVDPGFDHVVLEADMARPGHVVLLESWAPEWRATVDGADAPVLPANIVFRAVPVGPGRHRVEMRYRPLAPALGLGLSLATVAGLTLAAARAWRRRPGDAIILG